MELSDTTVRSLAGRQLERLLRHIALECGLCLLAVALGALASLPYAPPTYVLAWAGLVAASCALRYGLLVAARRTADEPRASSGRHAALVGTVAVTALGFGALTAWVAATQGTAASAPLLSLSVAIALLFAALLHGSSPGAVAAIGGALLPPAVTLALAGRDGLHASLGLVFAAVAAGATARALRGQARETALQQAENEQLREYLDQRRDQIDKLQVELKTTQGKCDEAEQAVRRNAADLGLVEGKAKALAETLARVSPLDQATGLDNRRHFEQVSEAEWRRALRAGKPVSLVIVDVDEFERYAARHGQQSASTVLKRIAQVLRAAGRRPGDAAVRYDETRLALLLPGCDLRNAARLAEAVRKRVEGLNIPHTGDRERSALTVHVGAAMMKPSRHSAPPDLMKRAEGALYEARFQGGNRVVCHQPLSRLRVEHWDLARDGQLSEQAMMQKLLVWGHETAREVLSPGARVEPRLLDRSLVVAILTGELSLDVEGHALGARAGDCVTVPAGTEIGLAAAGSKPTIILTANRQD